MNRCKTCKWWVTDGKDSGGGLVKPYCGHSKCDQVKTLGDADAFHYSYGEGGVIHTGPSSAACIGRQANELFSRFRICHRMGHRLGNWQVACEESA